MPVIIDRIRGDEPMAAADSGTYTAIRRRIDNGRCIVLDGGVTTELSHEHGRDEEHLWGIEALASVPEEVRAIHRRYVEAGVDVVTTNTWALPTVVDSPDLTAHWMDIARRGVRAARAAISDLGREGEVAVAFSLNGDLDTADGPETVALLARTLADEPPDLVLLETLSVIRPSLDRVVEAILATGLPLWLSFRRCPQGLCGVYGQHWGGPEGDVFGRAARRFEEMGVSALLVNCIPPDHVDGIVSYLRDYTDLPLGVYPNLGYYTSAGWHTESEVAGEDYAQMALRWREEGAQIIGGCCGTRPEHIASARDRLMDTLPGDRRRVASAVPEDGIEPPPGRAPPDWSDRRGRPLFPLPVPAIARRSGVSAPIPGTYLLWRYLFDERVGAHQRCLDIGTGSGLQTVQLALNGAVHVHAIDLEEQAIANTLDNAFRNGVADQVSGEVADVYPWLPSERYELVVADLPQVPLAPATRLTSHRPADYWGRGLVDQVIRKLPSALAAEGTALVTLTSLISRDRTLDLIAQVGLTATVVAWDVERVSDEVRDHPEHVAQVEQLSDGYTLTVADDQLLAVYVVELRHARFDADATYDDPDA